MWQQDSLGLLAKAVPLFPFPRGRYRYTHGACGRFVRVSGSFGARYEMPLYRLRGGTSGVDTLSTVATGIGMILLAYRHGLRASELCDLQWHQVELNTGRLHVRRSKRGTPSVHPMQGDEIRALRRLRREQEAAPYVFRAACSVAEK
jgi:hypothetical protein